MRRRLLLAAPGLLLALVAQAQAQAPAPDKPMSPPDAWVPRTSAELLMLDKLRGQTVPLTVRAGQSAGFGTLTVAVRSCATRPPDLPQNSAAFLEVTDGKGGPVFRGWVLSNTPSVGQIEHAVYDLRLAACR